MRRVHSGKHRSNLLKVFFLFGLVGCSFVSFVFLLFEMFLVLNFDAVFGS